MKPMLNFYKDKKIVIEINGEQPIEKVHQDILKKLRIK
jgi:adenylate kinase family enzyme